MKTTLIPEMETIMQKYVAQFKHAVQISPDDWEMESPVFLINDSTTIGEIRKWMADKHRAMRIEEFKVIAVDESYKIKTNGKH